MRDDAVERLFSLFTSSDMAEAIAGDLAEERERHGPGWFWLHVARTTLTLWRSAATDAPIGVLLVALAGCAVWSAPALGGAAAVNLFPHSSGSPVSWIALMLFWWGGALGTGALLVVIAPKCGMAACTALAVATEASLIALGVAAVWRGPLENYFVLFYTTGLLVAAPLLMGSAIARRRLLACAIPGERHR